MKMARPIDTITAVALILMLGLVGCMQTGNAGAKPEPAVAVADAPPPRDLAEAITDPAATKAQPDAVDTSCKTDADCTIKDVGSCCGARPQCLNVNSPTFPDLVKAECAAKGEMGVCGFPSISGCQCVAGKCAGVASGAAAGDLK